MDEQLKLTLRRLLDYFEMDSGEWPAITTQASGVEHWGLVEEELYQLLTDIQEYIDG